MIGQSLVQGATVESNGVRYRVWAPGAEHVEACLYERDGTVARKFALAGSGDGFWEGLDAEGTPGDRYKLSLNGGTPLPPPGSRYQPEGVHGPACVTEARSYRWSDRGWERPAFRDLVIYELHLGTFTPAGTFAAAGERMQYLRELGVNAIELMPLADFPGERGWGYDGVQLYAPARCYGTPDELRALVEAAHGEGIAVILDVVYNHFGPDGNYLTQFSPFYFSGKDHTPWGDAINFGHRESGPVREFFRGNVIYWMEEFHVDGFRLDATHAIVDASEKHILRELGEVVRARGGYIVAEDERNEAQLITEEYFGLDAVWADDFHHTVEVATIQASVYRRDFTGELQELAAAMSQGWYYSGQLQTRNGKLRGTPAEHLPPERFVFCISNHDQIGNRALGERLNHLISPATYRAASALLLLAPYTPLLFMGQEWGASTPFQYFTDHHGELGKLVEEGRRKEFSAAFADLADIPSPQSPKTFERSKLNWEEQGAPEHAEVLALYRELLALRRSEPDFRPTGRGTFEVSALDSGVLALRYARWLVLCDLQGGHAGALGLQVGSSATWQLVLSTNEARFGGENGASWHSAAQSFAFNQPEVLVLRADTAGRAENAIV